MFVTQNVGVCLLSDIPTLQPWKAGDPSWPRRRAERSADACTVTGPHVPLD